MIVLLVMAAAGLALLGIWWAAAMCVVAAIILAIADIAEAVGRHRAAQARAERALRLELERH